MSFPRVILLTGAAGYVGTMLLNRLIESPQVERIIAIDKDPLQPAHRTNPKVIQLTQSLAVSTWQSIAASYAPEAVIHAAWQIRELYGQRTLQHELNRTSSQAVFAFAYATPSVKHLFHFSSAAVYGASPHTAHDRIFYEDDILPKHTYSYAEEKRQVEELLHEIHTTAKAGGRLTPCVTIFRPAAITGPYGRYGRIRFGLQSVLLGNFKGGWLARLLTTLTSFVPVTPRFARQFVHEDDVVAIIEAAIARVPVSGISIYNGVSGNDWLDGKGMARAVGKQAIVLPPIVVRLMFTLAWHLTRGRIPTAPGSWLFYSYPIVMSGEKLKELYRCRYSSWEAVTTKEGTCKFFVPRVQA